MVLTGLTLLLVLFAGIARMSGAVAVEEDSDVLVLTQANFDSTVNSADIILVEFYAPWCGHCKHLAPEYAKAAAALKTDDPPIPLAKVDATVETALGTRFAVSGYPTLKVFRNGVASDYNGPREEKGIVNYMRKQAGPAAKELTTQESLVKFQQFKDDVGAVGYFSDLTSANAKAFISTANSLRDDYRFGIVSDSALIQKEGIVLYRPFPGEDPTVAFTGKYTVPEITSFLETESVPVAGLYSNNVAKRFKKGRVTLFAKADPVADAKQIVYYLNRLRKVAKEFPSLHFVVADKTEQSADFNVFGFGSAKWGLAILDGGNKYKFEGSDTFTSDLVKGFVVDYLAGEVEKYVKSEPVPAVPTVEGLTTVVGKTFDEIVNDPTKDVFIEFYAPWCGHCKSLAPKWEQLAKEFKDVDSLVIAKMDATANDIPPPFKANGYPTLQFVKANDKKNPITYDKDREVKPMRKFIKDTVSIKITPKAEL